MHSHSARYSNVGNSNSSNAFDFNYSNQSTSDKAHMTSDEGIIAENNGTIAVLIDL